MPRQAHSIPWQFGLSVLYTLKNVVKWYHMVSLSVGLAWEGEQLQRTKWLPIVCFIHFCLLRWFAHSGGLYLCPFRASTVPGIFSLPPQSAWKHICHDPARAFATFRFVEERVVNQITDEELELILSLVQIRVLRHCTRCIRCWGKTWLRRLESHATVLQKFKGFRQKDKKGLLPVPSKRELTSMFERCVVSGMVPRAQTSSLSASTASAGH